MSSLPGKVNEAFAAQAIACIRELGCDLDKTNVLGSGISLGHPIGCTGARILITLMNQMKRENQARVWPWYWKMLPTEIVIR